jgi:hypothetical protein
VLRGRTRFRHHITDYEELGGYVSSDISISLSSTTMEEIRTMLLKVHVRRATGNCTIYRGHHACAFYIDRTLMMAGGDVAMTAVSTQQQDSSQTQRD